MADWRMSTLNSNLSTTQRVINRNFAPQTQAPPGRNLSGKASPLLLDERSGAGLVGHYCSAVEFGPESSMSTKLVYP